MTGASIGALTGATTDALTDALTDDNPPSARASGRSAYLADGERPFWQRLPDTGGQRVLNTGNALIFLRFDDCSAILRDARFTQWNMAQVERNPAIDRRFVERRRQAFLSMEGVDHQRLRRLAMVALSPTEVDRHRERMRTVMNGLIDAILVSQPTAHLQFDAVADLVRLYPLPVICGVLGVPDADIPFFSQTAADWVRWMWGGPSAVPAALAAHDAMDAYMFELIGRRERELAEGGAGEDVISGLIRAELEGDRLTRHEVVHTAASLIVPGLDTTFLTLSSGLYLFAQHPRQWELLAERPELLPNAVEEILRFAPVGPTLERIAIADVEINGLMIPKDTHVVLGLASVNRDAQAYPQPDDFDITRTAGRMHMTFGGGRHTCLGLHLARAELQEALRCLTARLTDLRIEGAVRWSPPLGFQGPRSLPVRFSVRPPDCPTT